MLKKERGFTLIELLVVVAVLGFLSALVIPNAIVAIQKAKQKRTMKDIVGIATACADYVTDAGRAPDSGNQAGEIQPGGTFVTTLQTFLIRSCPTHDQWGNPFRAYTGSAVATMYSIPAADVGEDDFLIVSFGRDGALGGSVTFSYQSSDPLGGIYLVNSLQDFNNDLVNMSGSWIHAPRAATESGT